MMKTVKKNLQLTDRRELTGAVEDSLGDDDFLSPIPLTEEWLERFGFEKEIITGNDYEDRIFKLGNLYNHTDLLLFYGKMHDDDKDGNVWQVEHQESYLLPII